MDINQQMWQTMREAQEKPYTKDNEQRAKELSWLISNIQKTEVGSTIHEKYRAKLENWFRGNPKYAEYGRECLKHVMDKHGEDNRQGDCLICLSKVFWKALHKEDGSFDLLGTEAKMPWFNNMLFQNSDMLSILMSSKGLD